MHTKHSYLLKIRKAAALCAALLLYACSYEITEESGGGGDWDGEVMTVTLKVGSAEGEHSLTTKALSDTQENAIKSLYILAFMKDEDNHDFSLKYYATGQPVSGEIGKFSFSLRRSVSGAADTKLLLIANHNPYPLVDKGMTYDEVQGRLKVLSGRGKPAFADTGIPMFGYAGDDPSSPLEIKEGMQTLSAKLLRAVARVDVGVGTYDETTGAWNKGGVNFELTEIHVFKPIDSLSLLPLINNLEYATDGTPSVIGPSPAGTQGDNLVYQDVAITTTPTSSYCKAEIYLPEFDFNGGTVYDENHENRMALVIGGTYNGNKNYYRIDFTEKEINAKGDLLNNVLRNRIYRFSITNVSQVGYTTPEAAYSGKPVGLDFTAAMVDWAAGKTASPQADMLVRMNLKGINGTIYKGTMIENSTETSFLIKPKKEYIQTDDGRPIYNTYIIDYNNFKGEAKDPNLLANGGHYNNVNDALEREGPFGALVIAPDNAAENIPWRSSSADAPVKDRVLDAYNACKNYRAQGRSDWRLPRLSELMLLWMNKATINSSKGFTSLGESGETYWTGSEGPAGTDKVYTVDRDGYIKQALKSERYKVRCVRQVKKNN